MIDTDKYEGHTEGEWVTNNFDGGFNIISDKWGVDIHTSNTYDAKPLKDEDIQLMADAPLLLAEVKRLRKLEAAVVGSWMETVNRGSSWHKQLRGPCVELGYLTHVDHFGVLTIKRRYEVSEEYQDMAKQWVREYYGDEEE